MKNYSCYKNFEGFLADKIQKEIESEGIAKEKVKRYFLHVFGGSLK